MFQKILNSQFFKDGTGAQSLMRLITIVIAIIVLAMWVLFNLIAIIHWLWVGGSLDIIDFKPQMVYVLLTAVLGKAVQSFAERTDSSDVSGTDTKDADNAN